jgi:hypothetical protein
MKGLQHGSNARLCIFLQIVHKAFLVRMRARNEHEISTNLTIQGHLIDSTKGFHMLKEYIKLRLLKYIY